MTFPLASPLLLGALIESGIPSKIAARDLKICQATVWRDKHRDLLDPEILAHANKTISDKMVLGATAAMDEFLDQVATGALTLSKPGALVKMASNALEAAGRYSALCGAQSFLKDTLAQYGVEPSHSVSRITLEQRVTVENNSATPQPVVMIMPKE